ncbi:hypothetical protein LEP1GSC043_1031 [Leptospira weilii str. Ecochallenge]|uniref:Uncharacterized protein n=1 Tax=Leptospira weilii str. Ecochallenge TaxID=1049986 RepID=N1U7B8_9LEPT|nr:hypothetical protein LEP1GSC043_1031 [Leptospira weilii str. Ecochallenge]
MLERSSDKFFILSSITLRIQFRDFTLIYFGSKEFFLYLGARIELLRIWFGSYGRLCFQGIVFQRRALLIRLEVGF